MNTGVNTNPVPASIAHPDFPANRAAAALSSATDSMLRSPLVARLVWHLDTFAATQLVALFERDRRKRRKDTRP